jgi:hypothetical protein
MRKSTDALTHTVKLEKQFFLKFGFGISSQNTILQTEINNLGRKMRTIWGGNFPLDCPFTEEYFLLACRLSSEPIKPNVLTIKQEQ